MARGRSKRSACFSELDIIKKLVPLYNQARYCRLINGSSVQIYYWMYRMNIQCLPLYFYVHYDGVIYATDRTVPLRRLGSIHSKDLSKEFDMQNLAEPITRPVKPELLQYVAQNLHLKGV